MQEALQTSGSIPETQPIVTQHTLAEAAEIHMGAASNPSLNPKSENQQMLDKFLLVMNTTMANQNKLMTTSMAAHEVRMKAAMDQGFKDQKEDINKTMKENNDALEK